jgi:Fe-S-cluster-containing dehydrogenase component
MKKWNMIIDVAECTNCNLCTLAVMDEYVGNDWPGYTKPMPRHGHRWIDILQKERGQVPMIDVAYVPTMCNHCDNAPCIAKGGEAIRKREDGIMLIDPEKAKGRKDLVEACPYGHIWWNEEFAVLRPEFGTRPRVYYRNLWRYTRCFVGGTLSAEQGGVVDCIEGARVRLVKDGNVVAETASDNYGDFKFDRLEENSGRYTIEISAAGGFTRTVEIELGSSTNIGEIRL